MIQDDPMRLVRIRWVSKNASLVLCAGLCVLCLLLVSVCIFVCLSCVYAFVFCNSFVSLITHELRFNQRVCAHVHLPSGGDGGVSIGRPSPLNYSSFSYLINVNTSYEMNRMHYRTHFSLAVEGFFFLMIFIVLFFFKSPIDIVCRRCACSRH